MLAGKFGDVALQMLRTDLVEGAFVGSLEHGPEGLDPVGVGLASDILGDRVIDRLMVEFGHSLVGRSLVSIDRRARLRVLADKARERFPVRPPYDFGPDLAAFPVLHPDHSSLADRTAPREGLALAERHILPLPAEVGFIDLYRAAELVVIVAPPKLAGYDAA